MGPPASSSPALQAVPGPLTSPYVLALLAGILCVGALALLTRRRLDEHGASEFLLLLGCCLSWQVVTAAGLVTAGEDLRLFWDKLNWLFPAVASVAWLAFALAYADGRRLPRRWAVALLLPGLAAQAVVWLDPYPLAWTSVDYVSVGGLYLVDQNSGLLSGALFVYTAGITLVGSGLLLRFGLTARHLYWDQSLALGLGALAPLFVGVLSIADATPLPGLNLTPYAFTVSAVLFGNALFRYGFLDHAPATRRVGDAVVTDCIQDGVVVVDDRDRIVRANPVAERAIGRPESDLLGETVWAALPSEGLEGEGVGSRAIYRAPTDGRVYELDETPVTDHHDESVGHVLLFRDVTGRQNREQRLSVLNRTLRHNLRNDMNVVEGYADQLAATLSGRQAEMAETIERVAGNLVTLSTKARDAETVMAGRSERPNSTDLGRLLETVVDDATVDHPEVAVDVEVLEDVLVPGTETLRATLFNAVENAVVHNDAADPEVTVRVERSDGDRVTVVVADNGSGIPESELAALEEGIETPLEHGSGLGLWIISWGARSLAGEATFDTDGTGTTVSVTVPAAGAADVDEAVRRPLEPVSPTADRSDGSGPL